MQLCEDSPFPVPCLPTWRGFSCIHNFYVPGEPNNDWYTSIEHEDSLNTSVALFRSVAWSHDWHQAHRLRKIRSLSPFDDGRRNFNEFFFPLLKEFQVESTEAMMTAVDLLGFHVHLKTASSRSRLRLNWPLRFAVQGSGNRHWHWHLPESISRSSCSTYLPP